MTGKHFDCFTHQIIHVLSPASHSSTNRLLGSPVFASATPKFDVFDPTSLCIPRLSTATAK